MKIYPAYPGLIADPVKGAQIRQVLGAHYSFVNPEPVSDPKLLLWSSEVADLVGVQKEDSWVDILSGNKILPEVSPVATRYGGHQFGHWAGQLGDGRAIVLGELRHHHKTFELQLKGAGPTPYSRHADGRAVFRSSLREFLCSEAMHFLGVSTTRALSLILTGDQVVRDMFYDGNPKAELGAIVARVSPSFLRFGHYQILAASGENHELKNLADYTINRYYSGMSVQDWYREVATRTIKTVIDWMRVGFVHGVMNTDNMSILGETIDYGPYGWMESYDPDWTPNTTDAQGRRYRYSYQPGIALWNLQQLATALTSLDKTCVSLIEELQSKCLAEWQSMMASKLGLKVFDPSLHVKLDQYMSRDQIDFPLFYRRLADCLNGKKIDEVILEASYLKDKSELQLNDWHQWYNDWSSKIVESGENPSVIAKKMNQINPAFILRNYLVQQAIDEFEKGNRMMIDEIFLALKNPYEEGPIQQKFMQKRPDWAVARPGCSQLSCSS